MKQARDYYYDFSEVHFTHFTLQTCTAIFIERVKKPTLTALT